ncbi:MAG TPA: GNAT family N-acetyltransferase [Thermoleophilaceae bacterium]|nr:GNAT family N-acetyltransferase [Thermoleophilaceae bacterium]
MSSERIEIRPIRPEDREALADGVRRMSAESRYRRFFSPLDRLSEKQLTYLTEVDHHDHEALVAVETGSGQGIGVARFVRSENDPVVAEVAVAVADDWQAQGIGSELLHRLTERAREEGIKRFSGSILEENRPMRDLLAELGDVRVTDRAAGAIDVEVELPEEGIGAALRETLRAAARGLVRMRLPHRD